LVLNKIIGSVFIVIRIYPVKLAVMMTDGRPGASKKKVAWSPDGSQIAFDLSPQLILNGWYSLLGDSGLSRPFTLLMPTGTKPASVGGGAAAYPSWGWRDADPAHAANQPQGSGLRIRVDGLNGRPGIPRGRFNQLAELGDVVEHVGHEQQPNLIDITPNPQAPFCVLPGRAFNRF